MDCYTYREALSARLDGETAPIAGDQVEGHLAECAACRSWQQRATALTRRLRVRPAQSTPDLTDEVLRAGSPLVRWFPRRWPRVLLGCVAVCQLMLGMAQTFGLGHIGHDHGASMAGHLFNESTAWNVALGLGMLWAAWRIRAVSGLVPVLAAFLVVLTVFSIGDIVRDAVTVDRLATHLLLVLGLLLLLVVRRDHLRGRPDLGGVREATEASAGSAADGAAARDPGPDLADDHRFLGPAGYRRAG